MTAAPGLVLDCADPGKLAEFWSAAIGYTTLGHAGTYVLLVDTDGKQPKLLVQRVEEPKSGKNRMHVDIGQRVRRRGTRTARQAWRGRIVGHAIEERDNRWIVMADPEGNEFRVCNEGGSE